MADIIAIQEILDAAPKLVFTFSIYCPHWDSPANPVSCQLLKYINWSGHEVHEQLLCHQCVVAGISNFCFFDFFSPHGPEIIWTMTSPDHCSGSSGCWFLPSTALWLATELSCSLTGPFLCFARTWTLHTFPVSSLALVWTLLLDVLVALSRPHSWGGVGLFSQPSLDFPSPLLNSISHVAGIGWLRFESP